MVMKYIAGFDHLPAQVNTVYPTWLGLTSAGEGFSYSTSSGNYFIRLLEHESRRWLSWTSNNSTVALNGFFIFSTRWITDLPKTGKWHFGYRFKFAGSPTTAFNALKVYSTAEDGTGSVLRATTLYVSSPLTYYVEIEIDWELRAVKIWLTGSLIGTYSFTGSHTDIQVNIGNEESKAVLKASEAAWFGITDLYLQHVPVGDPQTRLGSVKVLPLQVAQVVSTPNWVNSVGDEGKTPLTILNTPFPTTGLNIVPSITSGANGELGKFKFVEPVAPLGIKFFQVKAYCRRQMGMESDLTAQLSDGINTSSLVTVTPSNNTSMTFSSLVRASAAPDGSPWTPEKIALMTLQVKSIPVIPT